MFTFYQTIDSRSFTLTFTVGHKPLWTATGGAGGPQLEGRFEDPATGYGWAFVWAPDAAQPEVSWQAGLPPTL